MQTGTITSTILIGGIGFTSTITRTAEGQISHVVELPAGVAGAVSATGVDGLATGHGLVQGDVVDLHWTGGGEQKCRRGITIDTASANAVTFDDSPPAGGDALPAEDTAVVVGKQIEVNTEWVGNDSEIVAARLSKIGAVDFRDDTAASVLAAKLAAAASWFWAAGQGVDNPFADKTLATIKASNGSTSECTLHVGVLYQSVE